MALCAFRLLSVENRKFSLSLNLHEHENKIKNLKLTENTKMDRNPCPLEGIIYLRLTFKDKLDTITSPLGVIIGTFSIKISVSVSIT